MLLEEPMRWGYDLDAQTGAIVPSDQNHAIYYGFVPGNTTYSLSGQLAEPQYVRVSFFDSNNRVLGTKANPNNSLPFTFTTAQGTSYFYIVVVTDGVDTTDTMTIEKGLGAKPVLTLGDSVTLYGYQKVLTDAGIPVVIKGFPGSTIATGFQNPDTNEYLPSIMTEGLKLNPTDHSGIIILAGFNDAGYGKRQPKYANNGVEWGDLNSDDTAYVPAFRKLLQHFSSIPRFVITPYKRVDDNWMFWEFNQLTKGALFLEGTPHFDMYSYGSWNERTANNYLGDSVHPNPLGANILGQYALAGYNQFIKPHLS